LVFLATVTHPKTKKRLFLLAIALLLVSCQNLPASTLANARSCTVVRGSVHDGDTIRVNCDGQQQRIRFACIDAPEIKQENGIASRDHLRSLLNRANNQVSINAVDTGSGALAKPDRFGRTVAEVYANGQLVQLQQVKDGMVWAYDQFKGNCPSWNEIERAFKETRSNRKGIFGGNPMPP
jgi:endonuclease YncB( thermonuclease family)